MNKLSNLMWIAILLTAIVVNGCDQKSKTSMKEPVAKKIEKVFEEHGQQRIDNYYWLNQREDPEVIAYLNAENDYTKEVLKDTEELQEKIFNEIVGRIKQTDMSVPYVVNGYEYYVRYEEGGEYPIYCRKTISENPEEEIMLNGNSMAEGHSFFQIGGWKVSYNNELLAYSVDTVSRRKYTIHFKNIQTGEIFEDAIANTSGNMAWANDNKTLYYATKDETLRSYKIFKHELGAPVTDDKLVYHESDPTFSTFVYKTESDKYLVIGSRSTLSSEYRILDANNTDTDAQFKVFQERQKDLEYGIYHQEGRFLVHTNFKAKNFRLMETGEEQTSIENWKEIIPNRDDVLLEGIDVFKTFYVVTERKNGLPQFRIIDQQNNNDFYLNFEEDDYFAYTSGNEDYTSRKLRYNYTSLKTPTTVYDYDIETREHELLKQYEVLGDYNPDDYITERLYATARDGVKVPISIIYKKGFKKDGSQPLLLYGYGSYGYSMESSFRSSRLSLIDRGFAFAIAHIRGGEEMGRYWYEDGKLLKKKNTFYDFIDCGEYLVEEGYTSSEKMFALGGSAGGLLVGAVINYRPDLFKGVIAAVPFVDVVTTMLDESIPLTTGEYDEWGNPNEPEYYNYMLSYSPYDNVKAMDYPALLVTTGLHDSQVQYWEPAKWVAKLRDMRTNDNLLLLWTNMEFGHGGASGRFEAYKETAMEDAFMLKLLGITE
ncbi:MAG: oligopeptidase B [Marinilabiliales bacterium]|nr:MAG: oligopeptidase B [Marinilabiliales bacterium]